MKKEKTYPFSTEGFEACLADIAAEKSRRTINRNTAASFLVLAIALGILIPGAGSAAFSYTIYELIPAVPMPLIP